jgi:2-dehydropantoate 2-reductase
MNDPRIAVVGIGATGAVLQPRCSLGTALAYLEKAGIYKDSMCVDVANRTRTEIDFLGGKVVEYGKALGIPTLYYSTMTNLVRAIESNYLLG